MGRLWFLLRDNCRLDNYPGLYMYDRANEDTDLIKVGHLLTVFCHTAVEGQTWKVRRNLVVKNDQSLRWWHFDYFHFSLTGWTQSIYIVQDAKSKIGNAEPVMEYFYIAVFVLTTWVKDLITSFSTVRYMDVLILWETLIRMILLLSYISLHLSY